MKKRWTMAVKLSVNLSDEAAAELKRMADENGVTVTEQLRRSIATEVWREKVADAGSKILVEDPKGSVHEVVFQR
jgi:predicted transcriptional regulator